ncbi:MAG TPA: replication initiation protein [Candidatus Paceibacterota bacterium]
MDKNYVVTKSNYFIMNSSYDLSLEEQKIILTLASMVQPDDEEFKVYKFKIGDFMKLVGVEDKSKYTKIPKITKELMKKVFEIEEGKKIIQVAWLSSAVYEKGTGFVELEFSPRLKPYMLKLNTMFTQYKVDNILNMKSKYSPRVYEFLKCNEFKKQNCIEIEIEELRKLLKANNVYPLYNDVKRYVIERTQKELKKLSDISFEFEEIKTGRKVTSLKFYIHSNKNDKNKVTKQSLLKTPNVAVAADVLPIILGKADLLTSEIAATLEPEENNNIKKVMEIMKDHKITALEAKKIYDSSKENLDIIYKVYKDKKNTKTRGGIVGLMIKLVTPGVYMEPKNSTKDSFTDYEQRAYDFDELEKKLLGWDKDGTTGEEFNQTKLIMQIEKHATS